MLENVLEEIKKEKMIAEQDIDLINPRVRAYKMGQINSAKERLQDLYVVYKNELLKRALFILTTGDQAEEFARISNESFSCFLVDAKEFASNIVDKMSKDLYLNKNISASVFDVVNNLLQNQMEDLDVVSYNLLMFSAKYARTIKSKGEMVNTVQMAIEDQLGAEVLGLYALEKVTRDAVNKNYKSKKVPIVLFSQDKRAIDVLLTEIKRLKTNAVLVNTNELEQINEETVGDKLKQIANQ